MVGAPTDEVADSPVTGTPISIIGVPTLEVAETPVTGTVPSVIVPQPFSPQVKVPQPG